MQSIFLQESYFILNKIPYDSLVYSLGSFVFPCKLSRILSYVNIIEVRLVARETPASFFDVIDIIPFAGLAYKNF